MIDKKTKPAPWTKQEEQKLRELYPVEQTWALPGIFNRSLPSIRTRAKKLGLKKDPNYIFMQHNGNERKMDIEEFKALYPFTPNKVFQEKYNISKNAVQNIADKYGLRKDPDYRNPGCYNKGHVPANKGMKGLDPGPNAWKTYFKKGHKPANELYDGAIRIRRSTKGNRIYKWIRMSKNNWKMLHVHVWEQKNGPVPEGYIIVFKDKDPMNCRLSNLECISLKENAIRNSGSVNLPDGYVAHLIAGKKDKHLKNEILKVPELIQLKRESIKLNRILNEQGN